MSIELALDRRETKACDFDHKDFIDHLDDWIEYLVTLLANSNDEQTHAKYERQIKYLVRFRSGANYNIAHNKILLHYYSEPAKAETECTSKPASTPPSDPIQDFYNSDSYSYSQITKALDSEDIFFLQGPPGTGKTTAIVEIVMQTLRHNPNARILITSETHIAVDNALDRLVGCLDGVQAQTLLRYPKYSATALENESAYAAEAHFRANTLWSMANSVSPELTSNLWLKLDRGRQNDNDSELLPRWMTRNLADKHQIIGVTCNQIDHLLDKDSDLFDLAIVDECSKATLPEWIMAMTVSRKCVLVGDHKQLPPTFCQEESEALTKLDEQKELLIRNGVIDRIFKNFPLEKKGTLRKQFRMLPHIGRFISEFFYEDQLIHHRESGNGLFEAFGWLTYEIHDYRIPEQRYNEKKILINPLEVDIIFKQLLHMRELMLTHKSKVVSSSRLSVAIITPYRDQCKALRQALSRTNFGDCLAIEIDTVDAFQGRQADVVFFSFVRTIGPATFYADDRRLNVAISRARDCVYLVGDLKYIKKKSMPALVALSELPVLSLHQSTTPAVPSKVRNTPRK